MMNNTDTLARRLFSCRTSLGYTQAELAEKAGVSVDTIQKIETGIIKQPRKIQQVASAVEKTPSWLMFGHDELDKLPKDIIKAALELNKLDIDKQSLILKMIEQLAHS